MEALKLANAVSKIFLVGARQLPPVRFDGYTFRLDCMYITERFEDSDDDLHLLLDRYASWSEKVYQNHLTNQKNENKGN